MVGIYGYYLSRKLSSTRRDKFLAKLE